MKNKVLSLILTILISHTYLFAQKSQTERAREIIKQRGEINFTFEESNLKQVQKLGKIISIDGITGNTVNAYANSKEFDKFLNFGYSFDIVERNIGEKSLTMATTIAEMANWNKYPTYEVHDSMMYQFAADYPDICTIHNLGSSVNGRNILCVKISDNVDTEEAEPEFLYTGQMHGDEIVDYILFLRLIDYMLENYGVDNQVTNLIDNVEIWINPLSNPDGTYAGGNNTVSGATRSNANYVDLNRNYPDPQDGQHPDGNSYQTETIVMMNFAEEHNFVLSANSHSGAECVNYPWDTWSKRHADDEWWQHVSHQYADTVHAYSSGYMTGFNNGITNGYDWYEINGGRQDYMNYFMHCREFTLELSNAKLLACEQLPAHWNYNKQAFLNYIEQSLYGINGTVTNENGDPLYASITVIDHDIDSSNIYTDPDHGNYYRPIEEGTWDISYSAYAYIPQTIYNVSTLNYQTVIQNIELILAESIEIIGIITDGINGMPMENAKVELLDVPLDAVFTNNEGYYIINNVLEGNYKIKVSKEDYISVVKLITVTTDINTFNFPLYFSTSLSFETGDFSEADFSFAGNAEWSINQDYTWDGNYSAKSDSIGNQQTTSVLLNLNVLLESEISFYKKVSSESGFDYLSFHIDGVKKGEWTGEVSWSEENYTLSTGEHTLKWQYAKDFSETGGEDAAWIDYITLPLTDNGQNFPPYFETLPETEVVVGEEYLYYIFVNDLNEDTVAIECTEKPAWLNFEMDNINSAILSGIPEEENHGINTIVLSASDNENTILQSFTLEVISNRITEPNKDPFKLAVNPNPARNAVNITFKSLNNSSFDLEILNSLGKTVMQNEIRTIKGINRHALDISKIDNGLYFIKLSNNNSYSTKKFIKNSH